MYLPIESAAAVVILTHESHAWLEAGERRRNVVDPPKPTRSALHRGPRHRWRLRGRDGTRRRFMEGTALAAGGIATAAFTLPALGFAIGPMLEDTSRENWAVRRPRGGLQRADLCAAGDQHRRRHRRSG